MQIKKNGENPGIPGADVAFPVVITYIMALVTTTSRTFWISCFIHWRNQCFLRKQILLVPFLNAASAFLLQFSLLSKYTPEDLLLTTTSPPPSGLVSRLHPPKIDQHVFVFFLFKRRWLVLLHWIPYVLPAITWYNTLHLMSSSSPELARAQSYAKMCSIFITRAPWTGGCMTCMQYRQFMYMVEKLLWLWKANMISFCILNHCLPPVMMSNHSNKKKQTGVFCKQEQLMALFKNV